jgi:hypothetical protein
VLLTTENYPTIIMPALHANEPLCLLFFLSYFMLVVWFVMSLFLAIVFHTYKEVHSRKVIKALMAERRSLLTAFLILQDSGVPLEFNTWRELIRKIRPAASDTEAKVLFDFLDVDHNGSITIHEFLRLIEVLSFQVQPLFELS